MSFRTVEIVSRCKLEYSLNYLVIRNDDVTKIHLNEISTIIINSTAVAITSYLLSKISELNIKLIFCDEKRNPISEIIPYNGTYNSYGKLKEQMNISAELKNEVWKLIVKKKIVNQAKNLHYVNKINEFEKLKQYVEEVVDGDLTNREGHAAKVYFNSVFYKNFTRDLNCNENMYLNYGYAIILSSINRAISLSGFHNQLGIHHISETNHFNLGCDLIEPLRPLVDYLVLSNDLDESNFKTKLIDTLNRKVRYNHQVHYLDVAIKLYVSNTMNCLIENQIEKMQFIEYHEI